MFARLNTDYTYHVNANCTSQTRRLPPAEHFSKIWYIYIYNWKRQNMMTEQCFSKDITDSLHFLDTQTKVELATSSQESDERDFKKPQLAEWFSDLACNHMQPMHTDARFAFNGKQTDEAVRWVLSNRLLAPVFSHMDSPRSFRPNLVFSQSKCTCPQSKMALALGQPNLSI